MVEIVPDEVLQAFDIPGASLAMFDRGLINRHWLATHGERKVVLRRYNELRSLASVRWEQALVEHTARFKWPVAPPIMPGSGESLFEHEGRLWAAAPFLSGEANEEPGPATFHIMGRLLSRLHHDLASFEIEGQRPGFGKAWELDAWLSSAGVGTFNEVLAAFAIEYPDLAGLIRRYRYRNLRELSRLHYPDLPDLPVHGDFQRWNLLWDEAQLTGLLDFDFSRRDAHVCDLATMLVPFMPLELRLAGPMLEGYQSVRQLSDTEWALLPALARAFLLLWVAQLLTGWRKGTNPTALESITRTVTVRLPALDAAEQGYRSLRGTLSR